MIRSVHFDSIAKRMKETLGKKYKTLLWVVKYASVGYFFPPSFMQLQVLVASPAHVLPTVSSMVNETGPHRPCCLYPTAP